MSLEEHKHMVCRMFEEILNQGKLELASELLADDFVNHTMPGKSGKDAHYGSFPSIQPATKR